MIIYVIQREQESLIQTLIFLDNLKNGKFHQHLRDTFAPQVVRYVDLMESSIAQSIHKVFNNFSFVEKWEMENHLESSFGI